MDRKQPIDVLSCPHPPHTHFLKSLGDLSWQNRQVGEAFHMRQVCGTQGALSTAGEPTTPATTGERKERVEQSYYGFGF